MAYVHGVRAHKLKIYLCVRVRVCQWVHDI